MTRRGWRQEHVVQGGPAELQGPLVQVADQVQLPAVLLHVPLALTPPIVPLQEVPEPPKVIALPFTDPEYTSPLGEQAMLMLQPFCEMVQLESWHEPDRS